MIHRHSCWHSRELILLSSLHRVLLHALHESCLFSSIRVRSFSRKTSMCNENGCARNRKTRWEKIVWCLIRTHAAKSRLRDCLLGPYAKPEGDFKCKQIFGAAWRRNRKRYTRRVGIVKNTFHIRHRNRDLVPMNLRKKQKISTIILAVGFFNIALLCPLHATLNILFFTIIPSGTYIISYMYSLRQLHCANSESVFNFTFSLSGALLPCYGKFVTTADCVCRSEAKIEFLFLRCRKDITKRRKERERNWIVQIEGAEKAIIICQVGYFLFALPPTSQFSILSSSTHTKNEWFCFYISLHIQFTYDFAWDAVPRWRRDLRLNSHEKKVKNKTVQIFISDFRFLCLLKSGNCVDSTLYFLYISQAWHILELHIFRSSYSVRSIVLLTRQLTVVSL